MVIVSTCPPKKQYTRTVAGQVLDAHTLLPKVFVEMEETEKLCPFTLLIHVILALTSQKKWQPADRSLDVAGPWHSSRSEVS